VPGRWRRPVRQRDDHRPRLRRGQREDQRLAHFDDDEPLRSIQLYGIDAFHVGEAVRRLVDSDHVDHIDLNFGCPAPKVTKNGGGSALPVRKRLLRDIIAAAVAGAGDVPITAKFRMGVDDDHPLTYLDTGRIAEDEGCAMIALHARTAEQLYSGHGAVGGDRSSSRPHVTSIPVLGNGDIWEADRRRWR
jgi:tRNA-dihydrouridine synthase